MKNYVLLLSLFLFSLCINAQKSSKFDPQRLVFGGDFSFSANNDYWSLGIAPQVGYKFTDNFQAGAGIGYRFGKSDDRYAFFSDYEFYKYKYKENSVSFNLFANYFPIKWVVLSIKPEIMYNWYREEYSDINKKYTENKFIPAVTVGGGLYFKPILLQLNYELIQDKYSPYSDNVFFSLGFIF